MAMQVEKLVTDMHPALTKHEASVEADRCYFCHDAPCVTACPTGIDIPVFIRQISTRNPLGAAATIFRENIFGGMCARDCPTETLCEQGCVRNTAEEQPVRIGDLQRFATDAMMETGKQSWSRAADTGKRIAVVGAGPAGIACAHRLAVHGHSVTVLDANDKAGGLNEYGIAAYKTVDDFAQRELEYIISIGGITIEAGKKLGDGVSLDQLLADYDAVFLAMGLAGVNALEIPGSDLSGVEDAVAFISDLRQTEDFETLKMPTNVVVIGGGMTAVDAAMQAKLLGAEHVTIAYRRGIENMNASEVEQHLAQTHGVVINPWLQPRAVHGSDGVVSSIEFDVTRLSGNKLDSTGDTVTLTADKVFCAIGQTLAEQLELPQGIVIEGGRIAVDENGQTGHPSIWAGGDCAATGEDLTVSAVQDGKLAAEAIHKSLA